MIEKSFPVSAEEGKTGERFVLAHIESLFAHDQVLNLRLVAQEKVIARDLTGIVADLGEENGQFVPEWAEDQDISGKTVRKYRYLTKGSIEVKTAWNFLFRTNDENEETGTIGIELWSNETRKQPGFLPAILNPENAATKQPAVQPLAVVYLLMAYSMPFAGIVFDDVKALIARLEDYGKRIGFDIHAQLPCGEDARDWKPGEALLIQNMWHIPFRELADLATVTMIGGKPRMRPDIISLDGKRQCPNRLQEARYSYLEQCADGRSMPQDESMREMFEARSQNNAFARIDHNLAMLDQTDWSAYPCLQRFVTGKAKAVFEHLRVLMLNMLAHEVPEWEEAGMFLITKWYLIRWAKEHDFTGSEKAWQSHLVLLQDLGLVLFYRPVRTGEADPLQRMNVQRGISQGKKPSTYRSVPFFTEELLRTADRIAGQYRGVKATRITKKLVARSRGQRVADALYLDDRKESLQSDYVMRVYVRTITQRTSESGYALPEEVFKEAEREIEKDVGYWDFNWFDDSNAEKVNAMQMYRHDMEEYRQQKAFLAESAGCEYRALSKEEKRRLGLPSGFRKWAFIPKHSHD